LHTDTADWLCLEAAPPAADSLEALTGVALRCGDAGRKCQKTKRLCRKVSSLCDKASFLYGKANLLCGWEGLL
jgi:hypothetical protein